MKSMSRRAVCRGLGGLAMMPTVLGEAQEKAAAVRECTEPVLTQCSAFPWEGLPVRYSDAGAPTRQILEGRIPGSEIIELHETSLAPGKMPHPAHKHPHAELLMVRTGTIEFQSDGPPVKVTAGGAAYCAPNQLHGFKNAGDVEATYFVLKVGSQPLCQKQGCGARHSRVMAEEFRPDTIVAVSTPPGRGGIGIVRLSGPDAVGITGELVLMQRVMEHARARFARVVDAEGGVLDEAVVTAFLGEKSYTGEDLVEISAHGAPVVLDAIVLRALELGARVAGPGEFTQRAFLAGKLDLTQAEAVHDLIAAQTVEQARVAAQQMGGAMSRRVMPAKGALLHLIALMEAGMDFSSELDDVDVLASKEIEREIEEAASVLRELAGSFRRGQLMRAGASLALVGRPNAGKSSLFNRLLERERSIVTRVPGTTRDTVEESVALGGVPVRLIDTAGLRVGGDEAEMLGIARSREALADADLVLIVQDATLPVTDVERELMAELADRPHIVVRNKVDLWEGERGAGNGRDGAGKEVWTSAVTGEGMESLREAILEVLKAEGSVAETGALNTLRQREAVEETLKALDAARAANEARMPHEVILMDLHRALRALDSLTGATTSDDILGMIFSQFCIGK